MKMKSFKNSLRFVDNNGYWWRVKYPNPKDYRSPGGDIQHSCYIRYTLGKSCRSQGELKWIRCTRIEGQTGIFCENCGLLVPDEVVAAAKLILKEIPTIKLPDRDTITIPYTDTTTNDWEWVTTTSGDTNDSGNYTIYSNGTKTK